MQIDIHQLVKTFGEKTAVNIDHFTINNGDILGLVGNNGAGKTTLFRLMLDLLLADQGEVLLTPRPTDSEGAPLSLIHISEPTRLHKVSRMPSSA